MIHSKSRSAISYVSNYNQKEIKMQESLEDKTSTGRKRPWQEKKIANTQLALAYDYVNQNKALRLRECANFLSFYKDENNNKKLISAHFCKVRLCPICGWRRSLKIFSQVNSIMSEMKKEKDYAYIFVTFTIKNCEAKDLSKTIDNLMAGWRKLVSYKDYKNAVIGSYRALEVTHNINESSENYDTYHPHFHCIFVVNKSYFTEKKIYLYQEKWRKLWQKAMKLDYDPSVDIRKIKGDTAKAVSEAAKYTVKDSEYLIADDWDLTTKTVATLDLALNNRRLVAFGGIMKEIHKKLKLDDAVDGDLVSYQDKVSELLKDGQLTTYAWNSGYNQYFKSK